MIRTHRLRLGAFELRVSPLAALVALLMLVVLISAGFWQLRRAEEKSAILVEQAYRADKKILEISPGLLGATELERLRHRRARLGGHYRNDRQYLLDNRTHAHAAGYHVLTPFRLQGSDVHVLVNRGWVPVGADRRRLPDVSVTEQSMAQDGTIVAPPAAGLILGASGYEQKSWPRVVERVDMARIEEQLGSPLLPFVLRLSPDSEYGFVRDWHVSTGLTPERHVAYAVQWFALATALVALCLWVAVKRLPQDPL